MTKSSFLINRKLYMPMTMNAIRIMTAVIYSAMFLFVGCCPEEDSGTAREDKAILRISASAGHHASRSLSSTGEAEIHDWSAIICLPSGMVTAAITDITGEAEVEVTHGTYTIYAVANSDIITEDMTDAENLLTSRVQLSDNSLSEGLVMFGSATVNVGASGGTATIGMDRLVAKTVVEKVSTDFSERPALASKEFMLKAIYMINVAGDAELASPSSPEIWNNAMGWNSSDCNSLLRDEVNEIISHASPYVQTHSFYSFENITADDSEADVWSPRYTRAVLECSIDGETYYYSIDIPMMKRNCMYRITEVIIRNWGSKDPDKAVEGACEVRFSESLQWDETISTEEES